MEKILITGGAGFVGATLVSTLLQSSDTELTIVENFSIGRRSSVPVDHPRVTCHELDIRDDACLRDLIVSWQPDVVIHLAAIHYIPYCNRNPVETAKVNIMGTKNLLDACQHVSPRVVVFASSAAVYPVRDGALGEDTALGPTDIYGITKVCGEIAADNFSHRTGCPTVVGRLFNVYGPGETNPHVIPAIVNQLRTGSRTLELGNLNAYRDYVHVTDVVDAILMLVQGPPQGFEIFNIGTGQEYSVSEVVQMCEDILGEPIRVIQSSSRIRRADRLHLCADVGKIQRAINWSASRDFTRGLRELIIVPSTSGRSLGPGTEDTVNSV